jgi:hypothetical protein
MKCGDLRPSTPLQNTQRRANPRDISTHYREAWHLLREPDGLVFG